MLAVGMGIQNSVVGRLGVRDLTTTVLTMTLTGIAADARVVGGPGSAIARRVLSIGAMVLGAVVDAVLVLRVDDLAPLAVAAAVVALTALATHRVSGTAGAWTKP